MHVIIHPHACNGPRLSAPLPLGSTRPPRDCFTPWCMSAAATRGARVPGTFSATRSCRACCYCCTSEWQKCAKKRSKFGFTQTCVPKQSLACLRYPTRARRFRGSGQRSTKTLHFVRCADIMHVWRHISTNKVLTSTHTHAHRLAVGHDRHSGSDARHGSCGLASG